MDRFCDGMTEEGQRLFVHVPPGETVELPSAGLSCEIRIDPEGRFLLGERGPPAPPGLILGRAWGYPVVRDVQPSTAAARAGLRPGDLIVAADGQPLNEESVRELLEWLSSQRTVRLRVRRGREEIERVFRRTAGRNDAPQERPEPSGRQPMSQSLQLEHMGKMAPSSTWTTVSSPRPLHVSHLYLSARWQRSPGFQMSLAR